MEAEEAQCTKFKANKLQDFAKSHPNISKSTLAAATKLITSQSIIDLIEQRTSNTILKKAGYKNIPSTFPGGYLDTVGRTPLVALNEIQKDKSLKCSLYAKCEFMNPGGTFESRHVSEIFQELDKQRRVNKNEEGLSSLSTDKPTIIHHFGIAGAIFARVKGHPSISMENKIRTRVYSKAFTAHGGFLLDASREKAGILRKLIPNAISVDHLRPSFIPAVSILTEINQQLERMDALTKLQMLVCTDRFFKLNSVLLSSLDKQILLIVVGTGHHHSSPPRVDMYCQVTPYHPKIFELASALITREGLLCNLESAVVLWGALEAIQKFNFETKSQAAIVLILNEALQPFSKCKLDYFLNPSSYLPQEVVAAPAAMENWWMEQVVGDIKVKSPGILDPDMEIQEALRALRILGHEHAVVQLQSPTNVILGVTSSSHLESKLESGSLLPTDTLGEKGAIFKSFQIVAFNTKLKDMVQRIFRDKSICIVVQQIYDCVQRSPEDCLLGNKGIQGVPGSGGKVLVKIRKDIVLGLVTQFDVLDYIAGIDEHHLNMKTSWSKYK